MFLPFLVPLPLFSPFLLVNLCMLRFVWFVNYAMHVAQVACSSFVFCFYWSCSLSLFVFSLVVDVFLRMGRFLACGVSHALARFCICSSTLRFYYILYFFPFVRKCAIRAFLLRSFVPPKRIAPFFLRLLVFSAIVCPYLPVVD